MKSKLSQKLLAGILSVAMMLNIGITPVFAATEGAFPIGTSSVCTHHVHDEKCGYTEGTPCTFDTATCEICNPKNTADNIVTLANEVYAVYDGSKFCVATANAPTVPTTTEIADGATINHLYVMGASVPGQLITWSSNLLTVTCADTVTTIGQEAFRKCSALITVTMPEVTSLALQAFKDCSALTTVTMPKVTAINDYAFNGCIALTTAAMPEVTKISSYAFDGCTNLANVTMPKVEEIYEYAFNACSSLKAAIIPKVTVISRAAFKSCTALTRAEMDVATKIRGAAFQSCSSLTSVTMPKADTIDSTAFLGCKELKAVEMPSAITIGTNVFDACSALTSVTMIKATTIGNAAFSGCTALKSLTLGAVPPSTVLYAFNQCPTPRTLTIQTSPDAQAGAVAAYKAVDDGNTGDDLWYGWTAELPATAGTLEVTKGSTSPTFNDENEVILTATFDTATNAQNALQASSINKVVFKDGGIELATVDAIEQNGTLVATHTTNTKAWTRGEHLLTAEFTGSETLAGATTPAVTITVKEIYAVYEGDRFYRATADAPSTATKTEISDKKTISHLYIMGESVPQNLIYNVGSENTTLKTVTCADTVLSIGDYAFSQCISLATVNMPNVTTIGDNAFSACISLTTITMPEAVSIGAGAFAHCKGLTAVTMPKAVPIGDNAFSTCSVLASLTLGATPPTVGADVFSNCPASRNLTIQGNTAYQDTVLAAYKAAADGKWYGWTLPTALDGTGVSNSAGTLAVATGNSNPTFGAENTIALTATFDKATKVGKQRALTINQVEFKDGTTALGTATATKNSDGKWAATLDVNTKNWALGAHTLTATFAGNHELLGASTTNGVTVTVNEVYAVYDGNSKKFYVATADDQTTPTTTVISDKKTINHLYIKGASVPDNLMYEWGNQCTKLKTVICADTVTTIGKEAFKKCIGLESVAMPNVTTIGESAFYGCTSLASIAMPKVEVISTSVFVECTSLTSVAMPSATSIGDLAFSGCKGLTSVAMPNATTIGKNVFYDCTVLASVAMPKVITINNDAFSYCKSLGSVEMPKVTSIGSFAFYECTGLASVAMPNVTTIGGNAFSGCTSLVSVEMSDVTSIGNYAFNGCRRLTSVAMPKVTSIGENAFYRCTVLASLTLGATPPTVGKDAFFSCPTMRTLIIQGNPVFQDTVLAAYKAAADGTITDKQWYGWTLPNKLDGTGVSNSAGTLEVTTGNSNPTFGAENTITITATFDKAAKAGKQRALAINEVEFKNGTTSLGTATATKNADGKWAATFTVNTKDWALDAHNLTVTFAGNHELLGASTTNEVTVTVNESYAVYDGSKFWRATQTAPSTATSEEITDKNTINNLYIMGASVPARLMYDWQNPYQNLKTVTCADTVTTIGKEAFYECTGLASAKLPKATSIGEQAFNGCTQLISVAMPNVTSIGDTAFKGCTKLTSVTMPKVTTIGLEAFYMCTGLESVTMPNVTIIGNYAFLECKGLKSAQLPKVTGIGEGAFSDCISLTSVEMLSATTIGVGAFSGCTALASVAMPNATTISASAFSGCTSLASAAMPSATTIDNYAFYNCTKLASLTIGATPPTVGKEAFAGCQKTNVLTIQGNTAYATEVLADYKKVADSDTADNLWYGWTLPTTLDGIGVSTSEGKLTAAGSVAVDYGTANSITFTASFAKLGENKLRTLAENNISLLKGGVAIESKPATLKDGVYSAEFTVNTKDFTVGNYSYTATFDGNRNLVSSTATETVTVTINKADQAALNISDVPNKTYGDGSFTLSTTGGSSTGDVTYAVTAGDAVSVVESTGAVTVLNVGTATITATKASDTNYNATTATTTITVNAAVPTIAWADAAKAEILTYTGNAASITKMPTVTLVNSESYDINKIQYAYKETGLFSLFADYTDGLPTVAGEYTIKAYVAAEGNYTEAKSTNTLALTINRADNSINNSSTTSKYYGENFHIEYSIVNTDTTEPTFTCEYKEKSAADSTYTETLPTNVGNYTMRVSATETQNYNGCSATLDFVINQAPLNVAAGTAEPKKWDGTTTATVTGLTFENALTSTSLEGDEALAIGKDFTVTKAEYVNANVNTAIIKVSVVLQNTTKANNYSLQQSDYVIKGSPIALADGPATPTFSTMDDENGKDTFTFNSTDATIYEYSKDSGATWADITASGATTAITVGNVALAAGALQVRIKATATHNASAVLANTAAQVFTATLEGSVSFNKTTDVTYGDTLTATASGTQAGAVLSYKWLAGTTELQSGTSNTLKIPGSAIGKVITIEVTATGYNGNLISTATSAVAKKAVTASASTVTKVYDGTDTATVSLSIGKVNEGDSITVTAPTATYDNANVGTGKAITLGNLIISGAAADWYTVTPPANVTGTITVKALTGATVTVGGSYTYTGAAITPTAENITVKDDATTLTNGTDYGYAANNNTSAGTATVTVTFKGNYSGTAINTFTIAKANPTYNIPTGLTAKYGQTLSAVDIGATTGFSWMDCTTNVGAAGTQTHKAKFIPNDISNYNIMNDIDVTVAVEKVTPTVAVTAEKKKVSFFSLGNHDDTVILKATVTGVTGGTVPTGTATFKSGATTIASAVEVTNGVATYEWVNPNAATHIITAEFVATANTNYENATGISTAFDIDKAEQKALNISGVPNKVTYGDNNFTLSTTGGSGTGDVTYAVTAGSDVVSVTSAGKVTVLKVGTATITATKAGDTNYNAKTGTVEITVHGAKPNVTWGPTEQSTTYTGSSVLASVLTAPTVTLVKGETFNGTIQYAYKYVGGLTKGLFADYTDGLPTNAGKYEIKAKIAADGNYTEAESTTTMTLTVNKSTPSLTINTMNGKTYDGTAMANPIAENMNITGAAYTNVTFAYSKNSDMSNPLAEAPKDAGTYYVQASVVAGDNTNAASSAAVSFTIAKASATGVSQEYPVVKTLAKDYTFDLSKLLPSISTTQEYSNATYAVGTVGNTNSVLTASPTNSDIVNGKLTLKVASVAEKDQTATVSISITTDNFTVTNAVITVKTVDKIPLTISNVTMPERVYNGSAYAYTGTPTFTNTTDNKAVTGVSFTTEYEGRNTTVYTKSATAPTNVGEYNLILTVSGSSADTYAGTLTVPFAITQKEVTVKAKDKDILAGAKIPSLANPTLNTDYTVAGFIGTDTLGGTVSMSYTGAPDNTQHGSYPITISGGTVSDNYTVKYESGTLTISIDVSLITAAITAANNAKGGIAIYDTAASSVANGTKFVTTAEMNTLNTAIQTATDAKASCTTLAQVQAAVKALDDAVADFKAAIKSGTYTAPTTAPTPAPTPKATDGDNDAQNPKPTTQKPTVGKTTAAAEVDADGKATVTVPEKSITDAITNAQQTAKKNGTEENGISVEIEVTGGENINSVSTTLSEESIKELTSAGVKEVTFKSEMADVTIDLETLQQIQKEQGDDVTITVSKADVSSLDEKTKAEIGDRPVYELNLTRADGTRVTNFDGSITIAIPYIMQEGENPANIAVVYINEKGEKEIMSGSGYDEKTQSVIFTTRHFSTFAIVLMPDKNDAPITDIEQADGTTQDVGNANETVNTQGGISTGIMVTIVIAAILAIAIVAGGVVVIVKKRRE